MRTYLETSHHRSFNLLSNVVIYVRVSNKNNISYLLCITFVLGFTKYIYVCAHVLGGFLINTINSVFNNNFNLLLMLHNITCVIRKI